MHLICQLSMPCIQFMSMISLSFKSMSVNFARQTDKTKKQRETENVSESSPGLRGYSVTLMSVWWNAGTK